MVVEAQRLPVETLARAAAEVAASGDLRSALGAIARAAAEATRADLAVLRVLDADGQLVARAMAPEGSALGAEVAGTRADCEAVVAGESPNRHGGLQSAPVPPACSSSSPGPPDASSARSSSFGSARTSTTTIARSPISSVRRSRWPCARSRRTPARRPAREVARARRGRARGRRADAHRAAQQTVRVAVETTGARGGALWRVGGERPQELIASEGPSRPGSIAPPSSCARRSRPGGRPRSTTIPVCRAARRTSRRSRSASRRSPRCSSSTPRTRSRRRPSCRHWRRSPHVPRMRCARPSTRHSSRSSSCARGRSWKWSARRSRGSRSRTRSRRRSSGSPSSCRSTRSACYLREDGRLFAAAGRGLAGGHDEIAGRLSRRALGAAARARGNPGTSVSATEPGACGDTRGTHVGRAELGGRGPAPACRTSPIGLLIAYPGARTIGESDTALLAALAAQLAVAVQNARLHEQAKELGEALGEVLETGTAELAAGERAVRDLAFVRPEPLAREDARDRHLDDRRGARRRRGGDPRPRRARRPVRAARGARRRLAAGRRGADDPRAPAAAPARSHEPLVLDIPTARRLGGAHALLIPFLDKGSTAALLPIATATELLAQLTILSLDPARADQRRDADDRRHDRPAGRARNRQRAPLPAAEAVRGDDAAVAAAA